MNMKRAGVSTSVQIVSIVVAFLIGLGIMYAAAPSFVGAKTTTTTVTTTSVSTATVTGGGGGTTTTSTATTSTSQATGAPISIGVNIELSGVTAPTGKEVLLGAELAASQVNDSGGINGRPLKLIVLDDQSSPTQALANARILNQDNVTAIFGGANSNANLAVHGYVEQSQIPFVVASSEASGLTSPGSHWTFRAVPDDVEWGAAMAKFLTDLNPTAKIAIVTTQFSLTQDLAAGATWYITNQTHASIVYSQVFPTTQSDYSSAVAAIKAANPDYILNFVFGTSIATFQREMVQAGYPANQIMIWGENTLDLYPIGSYGSSSYASTFFTPAFASNSTEIANFVNSATAFLKANPIQGEYGIDYGAFLGYRSMMIIAHALKNVSGTITRTSFRDALSTLQYTDLLGKTVSFDQNGAITPGFYVVQILQANSTGWTSKPMSYIQFPTGFVPVYQLAVSVSPATSTTTTSS